MAVTQLTIAAKIRAALLRSAGRRLRHGALVTVMAMSTCVGCKTPNLNWGRLPDVKLERDQRTVQAFESFERQRTEAQLQAAKVAFSQNNLKMCRQQLDSLLQREPDHREANFLRITVLLRSGDIEGAREKTEELAQRWPEEPDVIHTLAQIYETSGDEPRALACFERAAALATGESSNSETVDGVPVIATAEDSLLQSSLLKAETLLALRRPDEAITCLDHLLMRDADQPEAHLLVGRALVMQGNSTEAVAHYESASGHMEVQERISDEVLTLVSNEEDEGSAAGTLKVAKDRSQGSRIVRIADTSKPFVKTAATSTSRSPRLVSHEAAKPIIVADGPETIASLTLSTPAPPSDRENDAIEAAVAALRRGESSLALQLAESSLATHPESASLYRVLGTAQYRLGDYKASREALRRSLALDSRQGLTYFLLGATLEKLGEADAARQHFDRARQLDPRYAIKP